MGPNLVETAGVEPTVPGAADLQSAGVTNFPTSPKTEGSLLQDLVPVAGEVSKRCDPKTGTGYGIRTRVPAVKGRCPRPLDEPSIYTKTNYFGNHCASIIYQ